MLISVMLAHAIVLHHGGVHVHRHHEPSAHAAKTEKTDFVLMIDVSGSACQNFEFLRSAITYGLYKIIDGNSSRVGAIFFPGLNGSHHKVIPLKPSENFLKEFPSSCPYVHGDEEGALEQVMQDPSIWLGLGFREDAHPRIVLFKDDEPYSFERPSIYQGTKEIDFTVITLGHGVETSPQEDLIGVTSGGQQMNNPVAPTDFSLLLAMCMVFFIAMAGLTRPLIAQAMRQHHQLTMAKEQKETAMFLLVDHEAERDLRKMKKIRKSGTS